MFIALIKGFLSTIAIKLLDNYRQLSLQLLRIEAAKAYIHGVKMARLSTLMLMRLGLVIGLICFGMVLVHICLFILLPWSIESKAILGLGLGLVYLIGGGVVLYINMSEQNWMDKSGATKLLNEALRPSDR